jgi:hypothetical protein
VLPALEFLQKKFSAVAKTDRIAKPERGGAQLYECHLLGRTDSDFRAAGASGYPSTAAAHQVARRQQKFV